MARPPHADPRIGDIQRYIESVLSDGGGVRDLLLSDHTVLERLGLWRDDWGHPLPSLIVFDRCGAVIPLDGIEGAFNVGWTEIGFHLHC